MGLKTTERPPTPGFLDCSPKTLADVLEPSPALRDRSGLPQFFMIQGSGAGDIAGIAGTRSVSAAVPDTRSHPTDNAGNCGDRSWDGRPWGTTGARPSPRLASPTAERHLASLLQQLRRER
ncbi:hypothetical protein HPB52_007724 [Rhipicephalus sanguineus]|uniref:Uncharacterized protein n=1 Tax=Rhipicephalus sanguineus TaxID=34632 RepID=A0A9D4PRA1_RHISA|nr:hypothetical protein HPB52_007724 [Rhipicephalus sanguineus]